MTMDSALCAICSGHKCILAWLTATGSVLQRAFKICMVKSKNPEFIFDDNAKHKQFKKSFGKSIRMAENDIW